MKPPPPLEFRPPGVPKKVDDYHGHDTERSITNSNRGRTTKSRAITFCDLPAELRLKIWEIASSYLNVPRVHCIKELPGKNGFISNQPVSALLHVCRESRLCYFETTSTKFPFKTSYIKHIEFAFKTYINFEIDIIYIAGIHNERKAFSRWLICFDTWHIRNLAMTKELYCKLPVHGRIYEAHMKLYTRDDDVRIIVVFQDNRELGEIWSDLDMTFRDLTAKQKRSGRGAHAVMYTRKLMKVRNHWCLLNNEYQVGSRFVVPGSHKGNQLGNGSASRHLSYLCRSVFISRFARRDFNNILGARPYWER